jgi:RNA polymerase sigma-70 factor (ECF subfamily)
MDEIEIITMLNDRDQSVITVIASKYEAYCKHIARNILDNDEDVEECLNDVYMRVWESIPPNHPDNLAAYIGKITRNVAFNRYRSKHAEKRGGNISLVLNELSEIVSNDPTPEQEFDRRELTAAINVFLASLPQWKRYIFVRRCYYADSVSEIAKVCRKTESHISITLTRLRRKLHKFLVERGFDL